MSLKPSLIKAVPVEIIRAARAAFPKGICIFQCAMNPAFCLKMPTLPGFFRAAVRRRLRRGDWL